MRARATRTASVALAVATSLTMTTGAGATGDVTARSTSPTVVKEVSPVDADGVLKPRYEVADRYGGARCQRGSALTGTAYRCHTSQSPQGVLDPCWVTTTSDYVICLDVPWRKHKVNRLHVTSGYDDADGFRHQRWPWGLRPAIHRRCLLHPSAVEYAGGRPIHYYCNKHTVLAGRLDRSGARWRMHAYRNTTPHSVQPTYMALGWVRIVTAWRGEPSRTD
jgi:hypothetical protein